MKNLQMKNTVIIKVVPDKLNCKFSVEKADDNLEIQFAWLLDELKVKKNSMPKTIVYCRSISSCGELYTMFDEAIGDDGSNVMFGMYHSKTPKRIQDNVLASLVVPDGNIRLVFATNALGMGINVPNVRRVIHYGIPHEVEEYVQEVGRGGRYKLNFEAVIYYRPFHLIHCDESMRNYVKNLLKECRRQLLMKYFNEKCRQMQLMHECCDTCAMKCNCGRESCVRNEKPKVRSKIVQSHTLVRSVDQEDRDLLREILQDNFMATQSTSIFGFGRLAELDDETVEDIVNNCQFIFNCDYILEKFPVYNYKLASEILVAVNDVFGDLEELGKISEKELVKCANSDPLMLDVEEWCTRCGSDSDSDSDNDHSQGLEID